MENLLTPGIQCTDPDQLQFCRKLSDTEYWYCEPNFYHDDLFPGADTTARRMYDKYRGNPNGLLAAAATDPEVRAFVLNDKLWRCGSTDISEIDPDTVAELLESYGYNDRNPLAPEEYNQIVIECYFETYIADYSNDI